MKEIRDNHMILVREDGSKIHVGDALQSYHGQFSNIRGGHSPRHDGSPGKIIMDSGEYYPGVYGARWVPEE